MLAQLMLLAQLAVSVSAPDTVAACEPVVVTLQLRARGAEPPRVILPDLRPFSLVQSSARPGGETDARQVRWVTDEYRYTLSTSRAGVYVIPPFLVRLGSETVRSDPLRIVVRRSARDAPEIIRRAGVASDRPVHFLALASPDTVYVGQQVTYQAAAFLADSVHARLRRNPEFHPPDISGMLAYDLPFARGHVPRGGDNRCYDVPVFQRAVFPLAAGTYRIPPAQLIYTLPRAFSFFSREESFELKTDSLLVVVRDPPVDGQPHDFGGAVGHFTLEAVMDTVGARVGVPMVLTVRVNGRGNMRLLPRPSVDIPWASLVAADARVEVASESVISGWKEFDWIVTPLADGMHDGGSISYPFFDPDEERYRTAEYRLTPLRIAPGALARLPAPPEDAAASTLRTVWRGPARRPVHEHTAFWLVLLAAPLPALLVGAAGRSRRAPRRTSARARLRACSRRAGDPRLVRAAFVAALAERFAIESPALARRGALARQLRRRGVTAATAASADALLAEMDAASFGAPWPRTGPPARRAYELFRAADREGLPRPRLTSGVAPSIALCLGLALAAGACAVASQDARAAREARALFDRGVAAHGRGDGEAAVRAFRLLARAVPHAPDAWANLGFAAWAAGDTGWASVGWQRAARLEPLAGDVRAGLAHLSVPDRGALASVPAVPAEPFVLLAAAAWVAAALVALIWLVRGGARLKHAARVLGAVAIASALGAAQMERALSASHLGVVLDGAPLRALPLLGAGHVGTTATGQVVRLGDRAGLWVRVVTDAAANGWIEASRVERLARD